jgi:hypothetical protein
MQVVLITGSRGWKDRELIKRVMVRYELVVVGDAKQGADRFARQEAPGIGCMLRVFKADWRQWAKAAGHVRNVEMVSYCKQLQDDGMLVHCHAFWDGSSPGTQHCMGAATNAGLMLFVHCPKAA